MFQSISRSSETIHVCASARSPVGGVSTRYIYGYIWSEHFKKRVFWDDNEDDAQNCSRHWNGIVLEDIFYIETWITAPDNFLQLTIGRAHNKDAGKMAKLFADALLLIVSLLNIFTVGKCY